MQPRDPGLFADQARRELDLDLQRTAIGAGHVVANRLLGVAAAIEAYLAAIGHMQIDRNAYPGIEPAEPSCMLARPYRRHKKIRRGRIRRISRHMATGV